MLRRIFVVLTVALAGLCVVVSPAHAISGGSAVPAGQLGFVVRVNVGGVHGCSGALVAPQWVLTADTCFANGDEQLGSVPSRPTTVTVGGKNLPVVRIYPYTSRQIVVAKLALRVPDVVPATVSDAAPAAGEAAQSAGYGRTGTEWVPDRPSAAAVTIGSVDAGSFGWSGQEVSACQGDTGGPVFRDGAQPQIVGVTIASGQAGCLGSASTRYGATAERVDDLKAWITNITQDLGPAFQSYYSSSSGIGGYNLGSAADQVVPFDYDHSGKLDHLVVYRPGTQLISIVKHNPDGTFAKVFASTTGIGGYDLKQAADRIVAFDYDHSGKRDHLLLYRPGSRTAFVVKHGAGNTFTAVYSNVTTGIGGYSLDSAADQVVPFDYDHSGKLDHLVLYRPGSQLISIVKHNPDGTFAKVFASTTGIGGYDLSRAADRIVAFDYDHTGKPDHLVLYRPGSRTAFVVKHGAGNTFTAVYSNATTGIGGYDLAHAEDQLLAYDYSYSGRLDHLVLYRPGSGIIHVLRHGTGNSFVPVFTSLVGVAGYGLTSLADRIVAFDHDHSGGANYMALYRPGSGLFSVAGRTDPAVRPVVRPRAVIQVVDSTVELFGYPDADRILEEQNVRLISGDGHILLADCATPPVDNVGVIKVFTTEQVGPGGAGVCFKVTAPVGRLDLEVPGVYEIRGDGQRSGYGHALTAVVKTESGAPTEVVCNPSGSTQVGIGVDPSNEPTTLLQLRVPA